ncbi:Uncharacterised protein [Mycobacteroides abscessus subsp. abscessus]|nr:Uncharacterised protein [Mycobacteroides abscessus subsp. abscessus]
MQALVEIVSTPEVNAGSGRSPARSTMRAKTES